jgi:hypothetical protein
MPPKKLSGRQLVPIMLALLGLGLASVALLLRSAYVSQHPQLPAAAASSESRR